MSKGPRPLWIPVVAGFLRRGDKILLGKRPEGHNLAGLWEFPGGKIELGELPEQALRRELREEVGVEAEIGPLVLVFTHHHGNTGILLLFYEVQFWKGELKTAHHTELKWVEPKELKELPIPDANRASLDRILKILDKT